MNICSTEKMDKVEATTEDEWHNAACSDPKASVLNFAKRDLAGETEIFEVLLSALSLLHFLSPLLILQISHSCRKAIPNPGERERNVCYYEGYSNKWWWC